MAVLDVLIYPDERLRAVCDPIVHFDAPLQALAQDMIETMYDKRGCGLAATQVGRTERLFVMDVSEKMDSPEVFVNPEIIESSGEMFWDEACLSFPYVYAKTSLAKAVTLRYYDAQGNEHTRDFSESSNPLACACIQHERNHLDGILYIDALSRLKRERLLSKMEKALRNNEKQDS